MSQESWGQGITAIPGRLFGPVIRKASVIIPSTGERVRRAFTFANGSANIREDDESRDDYPLLGSRGAATRRVFGDGGMAIALSRARVRTRKFIDWLDSKKARLVIKCSLAYLFGSMATYVPFISDLLGRNEGKHLVATCTVYFHPARSIGSMHEATFIALIALWYGVIVSAASMGVSVLFNQIDQVVLGHAVILTVFCAGGLGFLGFIKIKLGSPTVNVASSLASITIITILIKEGNIQLGRFSVTKIVQTTIEVFMAIVCSASIAFLLWPVSAVKELRKAMVKSTDDFAAMLGTITRSFLRGSEEGLLRPSFVASASSHRAVFTTLTKHLHEAKFERYFAGTEKLYHLEKELILCMQRLAQNLGGLHSAAVTQLALLKQADAHNEGSSARNIPPSAYREVRTGSLLSPPTRMSVQDTPMGSWARPQPFSLDFNTAMTSEPTQIEGPVTHKALFDQFINHLGPSMKSLAMTVKLMLDDLPFGPAPRHEVNINPQFETSLRKALDLYSSTSIAALNQLYQTKELDTDKSEDVAADQEEVAASCGHFSYSLENFAEEMFVFLDLLKQIEHVQNNPEKSWSWLKFWKRKAKSVPSVETANPTAPNLASWPDQVRDIPPNRHVPNIKGNPPFSYKIWKALKAFRKDSIKFSVKVGVGAAIYALPAFIPSTRPYFVRWKGEWGLISYMIVMSMTLGATNTSGLYRILGTLVGAGLSVLAWYLFPEQATPLALYGWIISIPCFYILLNTSNPTFGRFILLTYNISALFAYSVSVNDKDDDDDDDNEGGLHPIISSIAYHRVVSVLAGVIWGLIINRYVWPIRARAKLRHGLSVLWLRMALIWKRDPLNSLIEGESENQYMNISEEIVLQKALLQLQSLLKEIPYEFRLKGPFPITEYKDILASTQVMLDAFHGMSVLLQKNPKASDRVVDILNFTARERIDLCSRIFHLFYVLSSSIRVGFPLPETLPSTERARDRLLAKLNHYRQKIRGSEGQNDCEFELLYAYVLVTGRISDGLGECARRIEELYGVLDEELLDLSN